MKKIFGALLVLALTLACLFAFVSCGGKCTHRDADDDGKCDKCEESFTDGNEPSGECTHRDADDDGKCDACGEDFTNGAETVYVVKDGVTSYKIVYAADESVSRPAASELRAIIVMGYVDSGEMSYVDDTSEEVALEILFGKTNRQLSQELVAKVDEKNTGKNLVWGYAERDGKIAFYATSTEARNRGFDEFLEILTANDSEISVPKGMWVIREVTEAELEQEKADAEAEAERLHQEKIDETRALIEAVRKNFGALPKFPQDYGIPSIVPTVGEHPRIWVKEGDLAQIIANLEHSENLANYNKVKEKADVTYDGKLPAPSTKTYNYSAEGLAKIESLAFMYLVTGDKLYGYSAILATKNYLKTIVITNDLPEKRYYAGACMYVFSEVYDWCNDLLTAQDKKYIVEGVCNVLGPHFEIGVPPEGQGSVTGHGTGAQLLRNWISFSIAVYDDYPEIYNNVVGRFFEQFLDAPNWYYQSGVNFQGSAYGPGKTELNVISELIMHNMSGQYMYDVSFQPVAYSFIHYIRPDGQAIRVGDDYNQRGSTYGLATYGNLAFFCSSLYEDPHLKAWASKLTNGFKSLGWSGELSLTPVTFLILNKPWIEYTAEDAFNIPKVNYNGSPTGAITARSDWNNQNAWMTYTKIGEALANNHEHKDAGTFQIHYKGILAMTSSCYEYSGYKETGYGTKLDLGYNKQTISKNGLLIFNPSMANNGNWIYSGGQSVKSSVTTEFGTLVQWQASQASRQAKTLAHSYKYDNDGNVVYAYISGDITNAYDAETVDYVTRATISIQTNDPEHPLLFLVYDRIISDNASFKKTFLLHTPEAPTVNGNVITITNTEKQNNGVQNNGKLTSTTLLPLNPTITEVGGPGREFEVNGEQLWEPDEKDNKVQEIGWGRLEVSPSVSNKDDTFLHVMYVGDADETAAYIPATLITSETHDGAVSMDKMVFFSKKPTESLYRTLNFNTTGEGNFDYYFNGMSTGAWEVKVNGNVIGKYTVDEGSDLLTFTAPAGELEITPVFANLTFNLNDGEALEKLPAYYVFGEELTLPTQEALYRKGYDFVGWYENAELTGSPIASIPADRRDNVTLYAKWERNSGFISYKLGGGVAAKDFVELFKFGTSVTLPTSADISKLGCVFEGWYTNADFTGNPITEISTTTRDDVSLYAKWRYTSSVIIFNLNGGEIKGEYTPLVDGTKDVVLPASVERVNATFDGWYLDKEFTQHVSTLTADMLLDNGNFVEINVYAKWIVKLFDNDFSKDKEGLSIGATTEVTDGKLIWTHDGSVGPILGNNSGNSLSAAFATGVEPFATIRMDIYSAQNQGRFRIRILNRDAGDEFNFIYVSENGLTLNGYEGQKLSDLYLDRAVKLEVLIDFINKTATYYIDDVRITVVENLKLSAIDKYDHPGRCFNARLEGEPGTQIILDRIAYYAGNKITTTLEFNEIEYELNGGSTTAILPDYYAQGVELLLPTAVEKAGNRFDGWYTNPDFTGEPITAIPTNASGVITVYAKWVEIAGKLEFVLNDGQTTATLPDWYTYGEKLTLPAKDVMSKTGGEFAGWYDNPEFEGNPITEITATNRGSKTLYAKWELSVGVLDLNTFGGTIEGTYVTESDGTVSITLPTTVTRENSKFLGWYLDEAYTQKVTVVDASLFKTGDVYNTVKVYARWSQVLVENDFSENTDGFSIQGTKELLDGKLFWKGTSKGPVITNDVKNNYATMFNNGSKPIVLFSFEIMLPAENSAELYFRFLGESNVETTLMKIEGTKVTASSGSKQIATLSSEKPVKIDIVADFTEKTLYFYVDGAFIEDATAKANFASVDDYTNVGRCLNIRMQDDQPDDNANECIIFDSISIVVGENPYESLVFSEIKYELDGGKETASLPKSYQEGAKLTVPATVEKAGFEFLGWYASADFSGDPVTEISETSSGKVTLYAKWKKLYNAISYEFNGGSTTDAYPDRHTTGTATTLPTNVTKANATFLGWYDNPGFTGSPITEIPATHDSDITVYARYSAVIIGLDFDGTAYNEKDGTANVSATVVGDADNYQIEWITPSDENGQNGYISIYNDGANGDQNQWVSVSNMSLAGYYTATYEFDIWADEVNGAIAAPTFFIRTYTSSQTLLYILNCSSNGALTVNGKSIGTLTTQRAHVKLELSIAPDGKATVSGQFGDNEAVTTSLGATTYTDLSGITIAQFYFSTTNVDVDGTTVAPKAYVDNIKISAN